MMFFFIIIGSFGRFEVKQVDGNTVQQYAHVSSLCGFGGGTEVKLDGPNWWVSERSEEGTHTSDQFDR